MWIRTTGSVGRLYTELGSTAVSQAEANAVTKLLATTQALTVQEGADIDAAIDRINKDFISQQVTTQTQLINAVGTQIVARIDDKATEIINHGDANW